MKQLTILVPKGEGNNLSSIIGSHKIFTRANEIFQDKGKEAVFTISLAGTETEQSYYSELFTIRPQKLLTDISDSDLIIVPAINQNIDFIGNNREMLAWIKEQYKKGAEVASMCTGTFLLAATGLLNGQTASTHWSAEEQFIKMFPKVDLRTDLLITDKDGIYTNGGAYSFLNLLLYLVEKYYDRQTALRCSKIFQIDIDRARQSEFIIFASQKSHQDDLIKEVQEYIERHFPSNISVELLCDVFAVNRRNFDRRFVKATGNTALEYIQRTRMEAAKRDLENSRKTVNEIMCEVGYSDPKAFRKVFKKITGLSPIAYKEKYNLDSITV